MVWLDSPLPLEVEKIIHDWECRFLSCSEYNISLECGRCGGLVVRTKEQILHGERCLCSSFSKIKEVRKFARKNNAMVLGSDTELYRRLKTREKVRWICKKNHFFREYYDVVIDLKRYEVAVHDEKISLTPTEFKLLSLMASKRGMVFSREQILDYLWGAEKAVIDRTVDMHVKNLRKKLGDSASYIRNVRGIGYKIEE